MDFYDKIQFFTLILLKANKRLRGTKLNEKFGWDRERGQAKVTTKTGGFWLNLFLFWVNLVVSVKFLSKFPVLVSNFHVNLIEKTYFEQISRKLRKIQFPAGLYLKTVQNYILTKILSENVLPTSDSITKIEKNWQAVFREANKPENYWKKLF